MFGMSGRVYLIGAGPGDPGLLTLRGAQLLAQADVVLYDGLSNLELLFHAPRALHVCVGKHGQSRIWRQEEIIQEILRHAGQGKIVARLKGGDPAIFARTAEEIDALREAGIPFEIVPGITAALAAGSYAGIPVTHREIASAVALVTGHEEPSKLESSLDWIALAQFPGTLVVYMGVTSAETWTRLLIQGGKSPETPVAIVRRCSLPDQFTVRCCLKEVPTQLGSGRIRPPVIVIIGEVARLGESTPQRPTLPLSGKTVLVTRPADQAESLGGPLRALSSRRHRSGRRLIVRSVRLIPSNC
jgi:uroporphyrinogen III methyltransferase/synthase